MFLMDDFSLGAPAPDAIKCDVEGAEVEALRGAERMLQAKHPWVVCEMHSPANDRAAREILSRFDYTVEPADDCHVLAFVGADLILSVAMTRKGNSLGYERGVVDLP